MTHLYSIRYRRQGDVNRVHRMTVIARDADEARAYAAIKDPAFGSTVASPKRRQPVEHPSNVAYSSRFWSESARGKR